MDWELAEPVFLRNLTLTPVRGTEQDAPAITTIEDGLTRDLVVINECTPPDVNRILVQNRGSTPLLMLDGEEITGSLQNRIIASSQLVEADQKSAIPVLCVEEQRWEGLGSFRTGVCSYPALRSLLSRHRLSFDRTQQAIWREIKRKLTVTRTISATSSLHDIYARLEEELDRYLEGFEPLNHDTIGLIAASGNRVLAADFFASHRLYRIFERKLVRACALDALEFQKSGSNPAGSFLKVVQNALTDVRIRGQNRLLRLRSDWLTGQMLIYHDTPLHISAFPRF